MTSSAVPRQIGVGFGLGGGAWQASVFCGWLGLFLTLAFNFMILRPMGTEVGWSESTWEWWALSGEALAREILGFLWLMSTCYLTWPTITSLKRPVEWMVLVPFSFPFTLIRLSWNVIPWFTECFCGHQFIGSSHTVRKVWQAISYPFQTNFKKGQSLPTVTWDLPWDAVGFRF